MRSHFLWELRPYFRQVAGELVLGSLAGIAMNTAIVLPPILLGRAIDAVRAAASGAAPPSTVAWAAGVFILGTLATEGPRILKRWWLQTANARLRTNVRADCLRGVLAWPMARVHGTSVGDLMARIIGDVEVMGVGVREFTIEIWDTVLFSLSLIVALLVYDPELSLLALLPVPAALLLAHALKRWVQGRTTAAREANAALTAALQEYLSGVRVLRLFGRAPAAVARVATLSRRQADAKLGQLRLESTFGPLYHVLIAAGVVLIIWQGGQRVLAGAMTLGTFVAYLELYLRFINRGFRIPQLVNSVQTAGAAYLRLKPLMAPALAATGEPPWASFAAGHVAGTGTKDEARKTKPPHSSFVFRPSSPLSVSLSSVVFRYPGAAAPALDGVSLNVPAGALVGVTGPVGSGKSALARALLGLYPLEAGEVRLDGRVLGEIPEAERTSWTGYLPQDAYLFSGTIRENVGLEFEATRANGAADTAAQVAALDTAEFPDRFETQIGELGIRVSGGQRQRIGLARAIAAVAPRAPRLLVLDDPFSAVDVNTEVRIVRALREAFGGSPFGAATRPAREPIRAMGGWQPAAARPEHRATILLCSHRLAAFPLADQVVVLDGGRIAEQGTHADLMATGGLYARIFRAQRDVEDIAAAETTVGA